jgi:dephospho-CoA kinase
MLKVGITGGIGSGKTLVCKIFEVLGVPVYYADFHAKRLMETSPEIIKGLTKLFGQSIIIQGKLNRNRLAQIIFNDADALTAVNNLVHPVVRKDFIEWIKLMPRHDYVIEEAAILFESGAYRLLDFNITVSAPEEMRIRRVMERDNVPRESVISRINNQLSDQEREKLADAVILNDESDLLIPRILELHNKLLDIKH